MVEFIVVNGEIELKHYDPDTTLAQLAAALEEFRINKGLKTDGCKGCGECCSDNIPVLGLDLPAFIETHDIMNTGTCPANRDTYPGISGTNQGNYGSNLGIYCAGLGQYASNVLILPEKPDIAFRKKAIREMSESSSISVLEATLLFEYNNAEPIILAKQESGACCFLKDNLCSRYSSRPYSCGLYLCNMGERLSFIQEMIVRQGTWHAYSILGWIDESEISHNPFLKGRSYDTLLVSDFEFEFHDALEKLFFYF